MKALDERSLHLLVGQRLEDGAPIRVAIEGDTILSIDPIDGATTREQDLGWLGPALWDLQINGRLGISFADPGLTVDHVVSIIRAQAARGVARCCPTLITGTLDDLHHGLQTIASACRSDSFVAGRVIGIHLEGPFLSTIDGYRGAHPRHAIRDPDIELFRELQDSAEGRIVLITLAPERPGALEFIEAVTNDGVTVAIGHSAADAETIGRAVGAGARLSTHLGNGIAVTLPRHPNPIWSQAAEDRLSVSLIADSHHLDDAVLKVIARAKGAERLILVSDDSPMAGLPPGQYGPWSVEESGRVVVTGTPYLAGANAPLIEGVARLARITGWKIQDLMRTVTSNPAILLHQPPPKLTPGAPANVIRFQMIDGQFELQETVIDGQVLTD